MHIISVCSYMRTMFVNPFFCIILPQYKKVNSQNKFYKLTKLFHNAIIKKTIYAAVILGTPGATPPVWLSRKYPDIYGKRYKGKRLSQISNLRQPLFYIKFRQLPFCLRSLSWGLYPHPPPRQAQKASRIRDFRCKNDLPR